MVYMDSPDVSVCSRALFNGLDGYNAITFVWSGTLSTYLLLVTGSASPVRLAYPRIKLSIRLLLA